MRDVLVWLLVGAMAYVAATVSVSIAILTTRRGFYEDWRIAIEANDWEAVDAFKAKSEARFTRHDAFCRRWAPWLRVPNRFARIEGGRRTP